MILVKKATSIAILSIIVGVFIYASLNIIAGISFSPLEAKQSEWAVAKSIINILGYLGFLFMLIALWAAITGGINGFMIASSKLIASLGAYEIINQKFYKKNKKDA